MRYPTHTLDVTYVIIQSLSLVLLLRLAGVLHPDRALLGFWTASLRKLDWPHQVGFQG